MLTEKLFSLSDYNSSKGRSEPAYRLLPYLWPSHPFGPFFSQGGLSSINSDTEITLPDNREKNTFFQPLDLTLIK